MFALSVLLSIKTFSPPCFPFCLHPAEYLILSPSCRYCSQCRPFSPAAGCLPVAKSGPRNKKLSPASLLMRPHLLRCIGAAASWRRRAASGGALAIVIRERGSPNVTSNLSCITWRQMRSSRPHTLQRYRRSSSTALWSPTANCLQRSKPGDSSGKTYLRLQKLSPSRHSFLPSPPCYSCFSRTSETLREAR